MDYIMSADKTVEKTLSPYLKKTVIVKGIIHLLIVLYAAKLAPELPKAVTDLFANSYFRLFVFSLILWTAQFSPSTSLLIALAFMITVNYSMNKPLWEFLENVEGAPKQQMAPVEYVPVIPEKTDLPLPEITGMMEKQELAPIEAPETAVPTEPKLVGCYPERTVDMTNVTGFSDESMYGSL